MTLQGAQRLSHSEPFRCVFLCALLVVEVYLQLTCISNDVGWTQAHIYTAKL